MMQIHFKLPNALSFIRIEGKAIELSNDQIKGLWEEEPLYARIRSHVCQCGKPIRWEELKARIDDILRKYKSGEEKLEQTNNYTAFKIKADIVDFYQDGDRHVIPVRIIYKTEDGSWTKEITSS